MNLLLAATLCSLAPSHKVDCLDAMQKCIGIAEQHAREEEERLRKTYIADEKGCISYSRWEPPLDKKHLLVLHVSQTVSQCGHKPGEGVYVKEAETINQSWVGVGTVINSCSPKEDDVYGTCFKKWLR
jgi:hypothetical protein